MISIRGAVTAKENSREGILAASNMLVGAVMAANKLKPDDVLDILFTATDDLNAAYPAAAARELGITQAGLMCMAEMPVEGSLRKCIRLLLRAEKAGASQEKAVHCYLGGASVLRPDLTRLAVAIDGPNNSGKSTVAKLLAKKINAVYADTGALYRSIALFNIRKGADLRSEEVITQSLHNINTEVAFKSDGTPRWFLNGEDVTGDLYSPQVSEGASVVSVYPAVRGKLLPEQRYLALTRNIVMDGRDIGSRVLPWARVKVYLDAREEVRVFREIEKRKQKKAGLSLDYAEVTREVHERDERDGNRAESPMIRTEDALYIDGSDMTPEEIVGRIICSFTLQERCC